MQRCFLVDHEACLRSTLLRALDCQRSKARSFILGLRVFDKLLCLSWSVRANFYHVFLRPLPYVVFFLLHLSVRVHDRVTLDHKNTKLPLGDFPKEALGVIISDLPSQDGSRNSNRHMRMRVAKEQDGFDFSFQITRFKSATQVHKFEKQPPIQ